MKGVAQDEAPCDHDGRKRHRRLVGKTQRLTCAAPEISYGVRELARPLQAPTLFDKKKLKRIIRRLKGTRCVRRAPLNTDTRTDANLTERETTRKSATGFCDTSLQSSTHTMEAERKQQKHFHQQSQNCTRLVQQRKRSSTSATSSRRRLRHAPASGYTQTAAQPNQFQ